MPPLKSPWCVEGRGGVVRAAEVPKECTRRAATLGRSSAAVRERERSQLLRQAAAAEMVGGAMVAVLLLGSKHGRLGGVMGGICAAGRQDAAWVFRRECASAGMVVSRTEGAGGVVARKRGGA